jgi:hypothetical protein
MNYEQLIAEVAALRADVEDLTACHARVTLLSIVQAGHIVALSNAVIRLGGRCTPADIEAETRKVLLGIGDSFPVPAAALEAELEKQKFFTTDDPTK